MSVKIPRKQAEFEIATRKLSLLKSDTKKQKEEIKKHKRFVFETARAYPYISDFIAYCCTDKKIKNYIKQNSAKKSYHYSTSPIPIEKFLKHVIYEKAENAQFNYLRQEILRMFRNIKNGNDNSKYIPTKTGGILGLPFIVTLEHGVRKHKNLISNDGRGQAEYANIEIQFLKYLWEDLLESETGKNWFPIPKYFFSKILYFLKETDNTKKINGVIDKNIKPIAYRNFFLYLNLIDNSTGINFKIDKKHFVSSVLSQHILQKKGKDYINNWYHIKQFIDNSVKLFSKMETEGLMKGSKINISSVYFNKSAKFFDIQLR